MATIDIKLKSYDELIFEITKLNTDKYLLEQENKQLKETIKEATRILNSAKNHYGNDGKNWALERVINLLGDKK